jgi:probable rRNA maturation factor
MAPPRWSARLARFCRHVLREAGAEGWDISILLCDDGMIADLNRRYRGIAQPTDVLSFSRSVEPLRVAGDIAISCDTLRRNAKEYGVSAEGELKRLTTHGILHLAGMDHGRGKGRAMLALQERIVEKLRAERIIDAQGARRRLCVSR